MGAHVDTSERNSDRGRKVGSTAGRRAKQLRANERSITEHIKVEECSFELEGIQKVRFL